MAVAYQTLGSADSANAATTCNFSVNAVTANANGCLIHAAGYYDGASETNQPTTVSGGETPVDIAVAGDVSHQYGRLRYDIEATLATSYTITNTWSTGQDEGMACACLVFDGIDQTTVHRTPVASVFNAGGSHVRTLASISVGDMCVAGVSDFNDNTHTASNCAEVLDTLDASGDTALFAGWLIADGTTEIVGATGGTGPGTAMAVALVPAAAGGEPASNPGPVMQSAFVRNRRLHRWRSWRNYR